MADILGLVHVYTGDGKGKTTAAIGLAVRAVGSGLTCRIIQFMKGGTKSSELSVIEAIPDIEIDRIGLNFVGPNPPSPEEVKKSLVPAMAAARESINGQFDLVILDEIITACTAGVVSESDIIALIQARNPAVELVLTGRCASQRLIDNADLVTEMKKIKHPFDLGRQARVGIEF
jgi:cob(I)alamin adenosyltransferase